VSRDPNAKTGIAGFGANGFVSVASAFAYRIDFENETNAAGPAQQVVISDQLSTSLDWSTFQLAEVGFGDQLIVVPPNTAHFETNVPVSYLGSSFEVQIEAGIRPGSGQVYAILRSIDPATSLPPPVSLGFLPPEDGTGRGCGHISYTIKPKYGLPTGTQIRNVALISFDNQPSIATNQRDIHDPAAGTDPAKECPNTIDAGSPSSHVLPLPAQSQVLQFAVSWSGDDDVGGSGLASCDVYVSDNSGAWTLWLGATTNTTGLFPGRPSHTYAFYSVARDNAGNVELPPAVADATTTVVAMPLLELSVAYSATNLSVNDTFTYTITVTNSGSLNFTGVVLSNQIPLGLYPEWVTYSRGSCNIGDDLIVWSLGNLMTNRSATMTVTVTAIESGTMTNVITVRDGAGAASAASIQVIQIGGPPRLSIALTNQQVILSWPEVAEGFVLEATTNVGPQASWGTVTNVPAVVGDQKTVTSPVLGTNQFYRLKKP
jgi:uncharacterized repeat protein (TIGR01451 family)